MSGVLGLAIGIAALMLISAVSGAASATPVAKAVTKKCTVGKDPEVAGYDPVTHNMYIPNAMSGTVTVFSGKCTLVKTIKLPSGSDPIQAAFDPQNNRMYVTDYVLNQVYDIKGTKIAATITGFDAPYGITYDPGDEVLAVANNYGDTVSFVLGTNIVGGESVGAYPNFIGYDPFQGTLLVTNFGSANVTIINAVSLGHMGDEPVGSEPAGVAFDYANSLDYVTNYVSDNVSVIDGLGYRVATISGFSGPSFVAWSQASLHMYVTNVVNGKVYEISGYSIVKKVGTSSSGYPVGVTYDEANDLMYVTESNSDTVYLLS